MFVAESRLKQIRDKKNNKKKESGKITFSNEGDAEDDILFLSTNPTATMEQAPSNVEVEITPSQRKKLIKDANKKAEKDELRRKEVRVCECEERNTNTNTVLTS